LAPFLPSDFPYPQPTSPERYGAGFIPDELSIQDWGVTYDEMEPFLRPVSSISPESPARPGNLNGVIQAGRQPIRGAAAQARVSAARRLQMDLCADTVRRGPRALSVTIRSRRPPRNLSADYTNPLGNPHGGSARFCGFCVGFGCANYSKASPGRPRCCRCSCASPTSRRATEVRGAQGQSRSLP